MRLAFLWLLLLFFARLEGPFDPGGQGDLGGALTGQEHPGVALATEGGSPQPPPKPRP